MSCMICNDYLRDYRYHGYPRCEKCATLYYALTAEYPRIVDNMLNDKYDVSSQYMIEITYDVKTEEHDGYCSDPCDIEEIKSSVTYTYPLLAKFDPSNPPSQHILNHYLMKETVCQLGSGYCGCGSKYTFVDARIIKK